jgi:hypothetical protein
MNRKPTGNTTDFTPYYMMKNNEIKMANINYDKYFFKMQVHNVTNHSPTLRSGNGSDSNEESYKK